MLDKTIYIYIYANYISCGVSLHAKVDRGKLKSHLKCRNWKGDIDGS